MVAQVSLIHTSLLPRVRIGATPLQDGDCKPKALLNVSNDNIDASTIANVVKGVIQ